MRLQALILSAVLYAVAHPTLAQTVDLAKDRIPITELSGPWRFHTGDDPAWSSPSIDDSSWSLLFAGQSWTKQGYPTYTGVAWYRIRVRPPEHSGPLALYVPGVNDSAQIFANGRLIGHIGGVPPHPQLIFSTRLLFRIPGDTSPPGQPLLLAIRIWHWAKLVGMGGGLTSLPRIGDARILLDWQQLHLDHIFHQRSGLLLDVYADILTALAGIGLFFLRRNEREYLWWGISQFFWACFVALVFSLNFQAMPYFDFYFWYIVLFALANLFQFEFYVTFLRQRHSWLFRGAVFFLLLGGTLNLTYHANPLHVAFALLSDLSATLMETCIFAMLWLGARHRSFGAPLLLIAYGAMLLVQTLATLLDITPLADSSFGRWTAHLVQGIRWPIPVGAFQITGDFAMLAVLVILVLRYAHSRQDEERLESELEAARSVQKVLIPDEIPSVPGFRIQTVYRPASQVGGDFFQIVPLAPGGALLAIGDVSGKGLSAAMTVSLLVGTFRTLAHYTHSPGDILRAMTQRMLTRSGGGFTTCLILRADPDGTLTIGSAGHPAPYLDGREIPLDNGLPLGLAADSIYNESTHHLQAGEQLTLLTDGVPEARNADGTLFGFDRTASIANQSAETIVETARHFGQEDDITVLSVMRTSGLNTALA